MVPKGTLLRCIHCEEVLAVLTKDLPDSEEIRNTPEYLSCKMDLNQRMPGIKQICEGCGKESDLYRLIVEKMDASGI